MSRVVYARYVAGGGLEGTVNDPAGHGTINASIAGGYNDKSGAPFVLTFSNRCFPTKAINLWLETNDTEHMHLVGLYFAAAGNWTNIRSRDCRSLKAKVFQSDPLYAVWGTAAREMYGFRPNLDSSRVPEKRNDETIPDRARDNRRRRGLRDFLVLPPVAVECNMAAILPYLGDAVFEQKDITAMSMALDDVCKALNILDGPAREVIAERIIALAVTGVRSPTLLRDRVLKEAGLADGSGASNGRSGVTNGRGSGL